jgi:hypothetical protein
MLNNIVISVFGAIVPCAVSNTTNQDITQYTN